MIDHVNEKTSVKSTIDNLKLIIKHVRAREYLQIENWDDAAIAVKVLREEGYVNNYTPHTVNSKACGGEYFLENDKGQRASLLLTAFAGKFFEIEFE